MTNVEFEKKINEIKSRQEKYGVKINFEVRDKDHLDCFWYGGEVGTIEMPDGYIITIGAYGDVRVAGQVNGEEIYYKDKNNSGYAFYEFRNLIKNDDELYQLQNSNDESNYIVFENNNWFEVDLITPEGEWIDLCGADNVLDDNILECFSNISDYFEYIEWAKSEQ